MRATTLLSNILGLNKTRVRNVTCVDEGLVVDIVPSTRVPRCSGCHCRVRAVHDRYEGRRWRHLDVGPFRVWLRYGLRRVRCPRCGVCVELVPWAESQSWFTYDFEEHVAYLAQRADKTTLSTLMRVAWRTVGAIIERVLPRHQSGDRLDGLTHIGVDELSYRRHHEYVTVIVDHMRGGVVWASPGKNAETFKAFFKELGKERCAQLEAVTLDMSAAYLKAVTEESPQARIIFDRFHVQRLAHAALDAVCVVLGVELPGQPIAWPVPASFAAREAAPRRLSNVVFMGMGEPLENYRVTVDVVKRLHEYRGLSARHLTVSTVGVAPAIERLAKEGLPLTLAVSLHAANNETRSELIPLNRRYPLERLHQACLNWIATTSRRLSFEWALIDGVNDTEQAMHELASYAQSLRAHVNLIPLNPTPGYLVLGSSAKRVHEFRDGLEALGINVTVRNTRGRSIDAACGQLASVTNAKRRLIPVRSA